ncbi:MAG: succinate--CoA ligase subunit beta [Alphaproteobacteria bacterium RIFCSPLOWO2_01_FULL_40_26]|nr:MAG: succinate--CoA ligase subunit beta [Alphaproteobacteria bacterium RIFCSPHIGHO2_02_FULL_40_34]OFW86695.1 MAG: succinate--CoA ligase subunit beta [Alphaproteobacteria bacterium RIFCSPHIGHO2_01_FULL_40_8]OFW94980.1 MAG: succinate--CoA ligase subunit beta [Alphaproteobacteria bacterium RIFCSPLOWO2_01_FULL_40_26]OFX09873.1 MAG: succinate--CoA ligase subunit beta [Alphaproteobacteria bacterium RIFCSPLOWO2_02_FULL_40_19]OFX12063.1 MAG: succinate--CoA ligase subunit beta [Alphaproteobacteria ba
MNIHEYQAKSLLKKFGVAVPEGHPAFSVPESLEAAKQLEASGHNVFVVKAQIHAGGRGKAGGVKIVKSTDEVKEKAAQMLGMKLVTHQTGPEGRIVKRLYIESGSNIKKEYYLSAVVDRKNKAIVFMASTEGGVEIEEVAAKTPEKIISVKIDPASGIQSCHARKLGFALGFKGDLLKKFSQLIFALYKAFNETDASQIEINPLVETKEGDIIALDAKINFDDNALHRHDQIRTLRDLDEEEPLEIEASKFDLNYIKMDGKIGCMVNGAGLAMATMDIIKLYGSSPANFLDVGGGATREKVTAAFKIILSDANVKGILVNIFGGIMRCDIIANGIIEAAKDVHLSVPLVVRLEGTNVDLGKEILAKSGLAIIPANDLADAAEKIVKAVKTSEISS